MDNLIPTPRTDKNGRTVTRHMKQHDNGADRGSFIPAPRTGSLEHVRLVDDATDAIVNAVKDGRHEKIMIRDRRKMAAAFSTYSKSTLERLQKHPWSYYAASDFIDQVAGWDETTANDYVEVTAALNLRNGARPMHIDSWKKYPDLHPANNDGSYPEERRSQLTALYVLADHIEDDGGEPFQLDNTGYLENYYITDDNLREFVLHPGEQYKREDIVEIVTSMSIYDIDHIKSILDNAASSLRNGVL